MFDHGYAGIALGYHCPEPCLSHPIIAGRYFQPAQVVSTKDDPLLRISGQ
jgi:hypothetical protein